MLGNRPYVISIAGFDPSAGAGILADVKCFEQHEVYGFGVCSALTVQTDEFFLKNEWQNASQIIGQIEPLAAKFNISACKIGLIKNLSLLKQIVNYLRSVNPMISIVLDPVLKASSGYKFHDWENEAKKLTPILKMINLITPNYTEMLSLGNGRSAEHVAQFWAQHCAVLLKGGHNTKAKGTDYLFKQGNKIEFRPGNSMLYQKHGSGCVLSSAITANIALGYSIEESCRSGKIYIEKFLKSNISLLGYHKHD